MHRQQPYHERVAIELPTVAWKSNRAAPSIEARFSGRTASMASFYGSCRWDDLEGTRILHTGSVRVDRPSLAADLDRCLSVIGERAIALSEGYFPRRRVEPSIPMKADELYVIGDETRLCCWKQQPSIRYPWFGFAIWVIRPNGRVESDVLHYSRFVPAPGRRRGREVLVQMIWPAKNGGSPAGLTPGEILAEVFGASGAARLQRSLERAGPSLAEFGRQTSVILGAFNAMGANREGT